ncbi:MULTISPECIES: LrgB family protein [unclassified Rummeliibacillus]|uniref:LrgB family protein n=1 Tax=unclassified Rummeliibacillus TaxID=2622809 RepID=UPI000E661660|nr:MULTISPECIES: LrgB family protein [unclassified Rummeliibacillus]RIJ67747.1 LrgB family protein [Rummeliibacillus sp. POC4]RPJ94216.1 LrgB family protein [Rummeliibacillus sp. TYF005]
MIAITVCVATLLVFFLMKKVYTHFYHPILFPVFTSAIIIVSVLLVFQIPYETYMIGGQWIDRLLGPTVVSLALPLYRQRELIIKNYKAILTGIGSALFCGIAIVIALAGVLHLKNEYLMTLIPKSITSPVAMQISKVIDGNPTLAAVFVIITGIIGAIIGPFIYKICKIETPIAKGVSMGSSAHGIGVGKLTEYGEKTLSMGSVSMTLTAVLGSIILPLFVIIFF